MARFMLVLFFAPLLVLMSFGTLPASAQVTGFPLFESFDRGQIDAVNELNLNVHISIPVVTKPGVGLPFHYSLEYDSSFWTQVTDSHGVTSWQPGFWGWGASPSQALFGSLSLFRLRQAGACSDYDYTYTDPRGTVVQFPGIAIGAAGGGCGPTTATAVAPDGSGYAITATFNTGGPITYTLRDIAGDTIVAGTSITDPNNNKIYTTDGLNYYDTLGQLALSVTTAGSNPMVYTYTGGNGPATVKVNYSPVSVSTHFGVSGVSEYSGTPNLVSSILMPDNSSYVFHYDGYGRVSELDLPTGGYIQYQYSTSALVRKVSDGSATSTWQYSQTWPTTTITDPSGNQTTVAFGGYFEKLRKVFQGKADGTGTLVGQVTHCYNYTSAAPCSTAQGGSTTPLALTIITQSDGGSSKQIVTYYGATQTGEGGFTVNVDLPTEVDTYDFGATTPMRKVVTPYGSWNGTSCAALANNLLNRVCYVNAYDGSSTLLSSTTSTYDTKGNRTAVSSKVGSGSLTTSLSYFPNGTVQTVTDPNSAQTTYTYGACNGAFPTLVQEPASLSRSLTWDCAGGVVTSVTDENGKQTQYGHSDPYWRETSIVDPLNNTTTYQYSPTSSESILLFNNGISVSDVLTTYDGLGRQRFVQQRRGPGSTSFDTIQYTYDLEGRPATISMPCTSTAGSGCSTPVTTTAYDVLNRPLQVTDGGGGYTAYSYAAKDLLTTVGPAPAGENTKQRQLEYDGVGRLTSVCEITSSSGSGACAQGVSKTGYWTKYAYDTTTVGSNVYQRTTVTQNAQSTAQTRTYLYDGVGRLTSETNPENGSTSYAYDADPTCGTSNGDLTKKTDAVGNVTCYKYDLLHRNANITHPNGSYASVTPDKCFVYDSAAVHGVSMSNAKGRLAEAYTVLQGQGCAASKITDEGFTYSARGEIAGTWEYTSAFGNWYQTTATYWPNGTLATLAGPTSVPTFTFGVDGEGRMSGVSASSGQNPVTATSYNSSSQVTGVTLGSGDSDGFTFDPNTGRMTQYKAIINGSSAYGNLTWNPNGSLNQLAITDPFNSSDTQTCSYSHGDLASLKSVSCGSAWSQTFTYDPFGNITKSGSISWMPGYNTATNRYTLGGTSYDADGNLLTDTFHTYTWNSDGQPVTVNTNTLLTLTYDALGRVVGLNDAGTKTDIAYTPSGRRLAYYPAGAFGGFTLDLPGMLRGGGQTANAGVQSYSHPDWLGSQRLISAVNRSYVGSLAYAPFGETYAKLGANQLLFTNQSNDIANDLYDFPARELHGTQGRWVSPDPAELAAVDPSNPQSWNKYAYVINNPLSNIDPLGLACYPFEKQEYGTCAPFMNNGVNFGGNWNAFYLLENPIPVRTYGCFYGDCGYYVVGLVSSVSSPGGAANNGTPTTPVIGPANGKSIPNVPPEWGFCSKYRDGSGGGSALYQICMNTPNSPWGNCVRGTLLNQYTPNPNPPELFVYLFVDHPIDFASCLGK